MIRSPNPLRSTAFALLFGLGASACSDPARPTGVLLLSVDSLRADHLSCYGYLSPTRPGEPTSPTIDRLLAEEGTLFERAVSTTSWTLPAHMALLSGMPDELHGVRGLSDRLHPAHELLAQHYQRAGWRTAGFFSGPNLHPWFGFERGFESYVDCSGVEIEDPDGFAPEDPAAFRDLRAIHDASHEAITGPRVLGAFEDWWSALDPEDSFFAFVHLWDVHYDYTPPPEFDRFDPTYEGEVDGRGVANLDAGDLRGERDLLRLIALYDGEIRFVDDQIGTLLGTLRGSGRLDETVVALVADHGDEFLEHGRFGHNKTLYEEVVRVPWLLRYPAAVPAGERVRAVVSLVDVAPTLLDLSGLPHGSGMWGRSVRGSFDGSVPTRLAPMELEFGRPDPRYPRDRMRGAHAGAHKVVRDRPGAVARLFDLTTDPGEEAPIPAGRLEAGDDRVRAAKELWSDLESAGRALPRLAPGELPPELEAELRATGYIDDGD